MALVEVLLAVVICAVGLVVAAQGTAQALRIEVSAANLERAAELASALTGELESGVLTLADTAGTFEAEGEPGFSYAVTVATTAVEGLKEVRVDVTWEERRDVRSFEVVRLIFEDPDAEGTVSTGQ